MENGEVGSSLSNRKISLSEWLEQLCEYYMAMGVSFEEFWYGDYCRLKFYEKAHYNRLEKRDYDQWLLGAYVYRAVFVAIAQEILGDNKAEYLKQPFGYDKPEKQMSQEELIAHIKNQLNDEAEAYARNHRSE